MNKELREAARAWSKRGTGPGGEHISSGDPKFAEYALKHLVQAREYIPEALDYIDELEKKLKGAHREVKRLKGLLAKDSTLDPMQQYLRFQRTARGHGSAAEVARASMEVVWQHLTDAEREKIDSREAD